MRNLHNISEWQDYLWAMKCSSGCIFLYCMMIFLRVKIVLIVLLCCAMTGHAQVRTGAEQMDQYLHLLKGKRVAILMNQTSVVGKTLLLDSLVKRNVKLVKIFAPEHGFRGRADAGAEFDNEKDSATGLEIVSLYGNNKKPKKEQLADIDILIYDIQDVGVRFYTYISTLQYALEACAENGKMLLVLDRPDPNGDYVDGPVLDTAYRSFVGMQPIPVVYGMTPGEYAQMLKGERWFKSADKLNLKVIRCAGYDHKTMYHLPVPPSPNLQSAASIRFYPSICFFEGTPISLGRGTDKPFEQWGHPSFEGKASYTFTPKTKTGATKPPLQDQKCFGRLWEEQMHVPGGIDVGPVIEAYNWYPDKDKFFTRYFETLSGSAQLKKQIAQGLSAAQIRDSWKKDIAAFKKVRRKYLLYKDFE